MTEMKDDIMSDDARPDAAANGQTAPNGQTANGQTAPAASTPAGSPTVGTAAEPRTPGHQPVGQQKVRFDNTNIKSTYCNVCNATSTREEVVINFGVNKTWDMGTQDLEVQLEHRIILSPHAAKRLPDLLVRLISEHEQRHGKLN
jgi:hypothetical protein